MSMQLLIHLPDDLVSRFRRAIPARERSQFVRELLEKSLPDTDDILYQLALQAQTFDDQHPDELNDWSPVVPDGFDPNESFDLAKLEMLCQK